MALISCQDVAFAYEGNTVISGLTFAVSQGDYLCIVGENGSGKSTLLRGLLQLKQPTHGTIALGDGLQRNEIGYMPQQTAAQRDFPASAYEVVLSGRLNRRGISPFYTREDKAQARAHMEQLGIYALRNRCYRELSGGQQQRVLLARALCATSKMLLLDEPVSGLDPIATHELYELVAQINRDLGRTILTVSHDVAGTLRYATHVLHLAGHKQLFFGTAPDYTASEAGQRFVGGEASA